MAYLKYNDSAIGIAKIGSFYKGNTMVPCEVRWGEHPLKGGYDLCMIIDSNYYKFYDNDKFGIKSINIIDENSIECQMFNRITRNDDILGPKTIIISMGDEQHDKVITSGIASNIIDGYISGNNSENSDISTDFSTEIITDSSDEGESDSSDDSIYKPVYVSSNESSDVEEESTQSSNESTEIMEEIVSDLKRNINEVDLNEPLKPKKRRKWYNPWSYLW